MVRRLRLLVVAAAVLALRGGHLRSAQKTMLWPGVTYEPSVQFTPHGPVALNVLDRPAPGRHECDDACARCSRTRP